MEDFAANGRREGRLSKFKFIDLFAGIGGFHQAMASLGGECVLASEIDKPAIDVYRKNYGIDSNVNVRDVDADAIPDFDVLCAGFPCQAFSKAGARLGLKDKTRGTLFFEIVRILEAKKPKWFILENVRHLVAHDQGRTWRIIQESIRSLGYRTTAEPLVLSPHQFGIPQTRERVVILGKYDPDIEMALPVFIGGLKGKEDNSIYSVLDEGEQEGRITEYEETVLNAWDEFYQGIDRKVLGFPVWAEWFSEGKSTDSLPKWKADFAKRNMELYADNRAFIDSWLKKYDGLKAFTPTHRKFEWQCGTKISSVWEGVIQFRPSGVRVKTPDCFQALVALVQVPIIGRYRRRLSVKEAARLQSFPVDADPPFILDSNLHQAYKQLGNSVNVEVIRRAAEALFKC